MATLTLRDIRKSYPGAAAETIKGVSLDVADREFVVFVGPSGCGKSTLLRMIAGLEDISGGELAIDGVRMNETGPAGRGLAMVFQSYALYPHMTVRQNMEFALKLAKLPVVERRAKVEEAARILQLTDYLDRTPRQLSGGQRQRVAIGRAIVRSPKVFLFDEPLSNLDAALRGQMRLELARLHNELAATMIYVTHDQIEARTLADKIVVLRAGRVEQLGSPLELYRDPANIFVAGFIGAPKMNLHPGRVLDTRPDGVRIALDSGPVLDVAVAGDRLAPGAAITFGARPEDITVAGTAGPDRLSGRVVVVEHLGGQTLVHLETDSGESWLVQTDGSSTIAIGDTVHLGFDGTVSHVFDGQGQAVPRLHRHDPSAEAARIRAVS